jgi:hypothetical protein
VLCGTEISSGTPNSISQISRCKIFTKKNYDSKITCGKYLENYHLPLCLFANKRITFSDIYSGLSIFFRCSSTSLFTDGNFD